jgi:hypothetical protein
MVPCDLVAPPRVGIHKRNYVENFEWKTKEKQGENQKTNEYTKECNESDKKLNLF